MGLFNGELRPEEVFPFPETLTEEQAQNSAMFIDPITKFYEVSNCVDISFAHTDQQLYCHHIKGPALHKWSGPFMFVIIVWPDHLYCHKWPPRPIMVEHKWIKKEVNRIVQDGEARPLSFLYLRLHKQSSNTRL